METSAVESPVLRFGLGEQQSQGCGVFSNKHIGKGRAVSLAMLNTAQLVLTIIYSENSNNNFWLDLLVVGEEPS